MRFVHRIVLGLKMAFSSKSYLVLTGFVHSKVYDSLKNEKDEYLPWMNYSVISLLNERLTADLRLFEYGSGSSTLYFAERVAEIVTVEYDESWYNNVKQRSDHVENISVHFAPVDDDYPRSIQRFGNDQPFDLVIVDGRKRVESAVFAISHLSEEGVVILDDTERPHYGSAFDEFHKAGFKQLTLKGLKPTGFGIDQTTIFYKSGNNCLGL